MGTDYNNFRNDLNLKAQKHEETPNKETIEAILESRKPDPSRKIFKTAKEMMQDLESDL